MPPIIWPGPTLSGSWWWERAGCHPIWPEPNAAIRPLTSIEVWGRRPKAAEAVAEQLRAEGLPARATTDLDAGVQAADIVSGVTGATSPLVRGDLLAPGAHLDLVGSFQPDMRESDDAAAARATIFVDTVAGASLSGDLAQPLADGVITEASITADLRALATGQHPGRTSPEEINPVQVGRLRCRRPGRRPPGLALTLAGRRLRRPGAQEV